MISFFMFLFLILLFDLHSVVVKSLVLVYLDSFTDEPCNLRQIPYPIGALASLQGCHEDK